MAYEWSILYDPAANTGNGQMKVTLGGESAILDLKPSAKEQGVLLDRFGLTTVGTGGGQVKLYLDDLQSHYTTKMKSYFGRLIQSKSARISVLKSSVLLKICEMRSRPRRKRLFFFCVAVKRVVPAFISQPQP